MYGTYGLVYSPFPDTSLLIRTSLAAKSPLVIAFGGIQRCLSLPHGLHCFQLFSCVCRVPRAAPSQTPCWPPRTCSQPRRSTRKCNGPSPRPMMPSCLMSASWNRPTQIRPELAKSCPTAARLAWLRSAGPASCHASQQHRMPSTCICQSACAWEIRTACSTLHQCSRLFQDVLLQSVSTINNLACPSTWLLQLLDS